MKNQHLLKKKDRDDHDYEKLSDLNYELSETVRLKDILYTARAYRESEKRLPLSVCPKRMLRIPGCEIYLQNSVLHQGWAAAYNASKMLANQITYNKILSTHTSSDNNPFTLQGAINNSKAGNSNSAAGSSGGAAASPPPPENNQQMKIRKRLSRRSTAGNAGGMSHALASSLGAALMQTGNAGGIAVGARKSIRGGRAALFGGNGMMAGG